MEQLLAQAKAQILGSQPRADPALLADLRGRVAACLDRCDREFRKMGLGYADPAWNTRHFVEAKRFLRQLDDAIFGMEQPDAAYYLNPLQGQTVAELAAYMKKNGIRFAPATVGCERYYVSLHRALAAEVTRLQSSSSSLKNP
jgi:hypothetical protein